MGTGYTRNDTSNNIADGNVINAADFDGEYDAIESAFNSSSGHTHDGTAAEGAPVTVLGPNQEFVASSSSVNPSSNAQLDLGTASLKFKDLYIDGTAYIDGFAADILTATDKKVQFRDAAIFINSSTDGQLDIDADTTIELNSPEVIATDDFRLKSDAAILTFGADNDVTVTHVADTGLDAKAASGFALKLQTGDTTVESGNTLGKISFNAPSEASGSDAILVGAEIEAAAEDTFSSTVNSTALVFKTNTGAAATERVRIKSDGDVVFTGASANMTWDTSADSLDFADDAKASFGSDADLIITHSGSAGSITNATGDLTLDVEGDIVLDANGADLIFKDNGTAIGKITNNSNNLEIHSSVSDADILFIGNDGGTPVTALTLDMSDGGKATFAAGATTAFQGATTITTADNLAQLTLISTDADANAGPILRLRRDSSSPADDDLIGALDWTSENSDGDEHDFLNLTARMRDVTAGNEDVAYAWTAYLAGTGREIQSFVNTAASAASMVFNEDSQDIDFRVESNTLENALYVNGEHGVIGMGIQNTTAANNLHILGNDTTPSAHILLQSDDTANATSKISMYARTSDNSNRVAFIENAAGNLTLDSATGVIDFDDETVNFGRIENSSSDFKIESRVQDKDIVFVGNDGGAGVTSLTLDMSDAGAATFNSHVSLKGGQAYASSASDLATAVSKKAFRMQGSSNASTSLYMGALTNDAQMYIQASNDAGNAADDIVLNPFGGLVGIGIGNVSPPMTFTVRNGSANSDIVKFTGDGTGAGLTISTASTTRADDTVVLKASDAFGEFSFLSDNTEVLRLNKDNQATLANGLTLTDGDLKVASGHGINFSPYGSGTNITSNLLDDYEEGVFTPDLRDAIAGNAAGVAASSGRYTKIGRIVNISFAMSLNSVSGMTGTNALNLTGLPYSVNNDSAGGGEPHAQILSFISPLSSADYGGSIILRPNNNTASCELKYTSGGANTSQGAQSLQVQNISGSTYLTGAATYETT